jgi:DNA-binding cell septation regulator SpoVG
MLRFEAGIPRAKREELYRKIIKPREARARLDISNSMFKEYFDLYITSE